MFVPQEARDRLNEIQAELIEQWHGRNRAVVVGYSGRCQDCKAQVLYRAGRKLLCPKCKPLRTPLRHPDMVFYLFGTTSVQDRDNQVQTVLDCMVSAGVLEDDSIRSSNGWMAIAPAVKGSKSAVISLKWEEEPADGQAKAAA